jgi:mycothiol synthase
MSARTNEPRATSPTALDYAAGIDLPAGYAFREVRDEDAPTLAELINDWSRENRDHDATTAEHLRSAWSSPQFEIEDGAVVLVDETGAIVAYEEIVNHGGHTILGTYGGVMRAEHTGFGLGDALVAWAERRAAGHAALAEPGPPVVIRLGVAVDNEAGRARLERAGFGIVRRFWSMERELDGTEAAPEWPEGIGVRKMRPGEERAFFEVDEEAFAEHWGVAQVSSEVEFRRFLTYLKPERGFDPSLFFAAVAGDEIVGTCFTWPSYEGDESRAYVSSLGVRKPWRRRGIGRALLLHAFAEIRARGIPRICLGVDTANETGATDLYEKAGMFVARRYLAYEKTIREGTDPPREGSP